MYKILCILSRNSLSPVDIFPLFFGMVMRMFLKNLFFTLTVIQ